MVLNSEANRSCSEGSNALRFEQFSQSIESVSAGWRNGDEIVDHTRNGVPGTGRNLVGRFENVAADAGVPRKRDSRAGPRDVQLWRQTRRVVESERRSSGKPVDGIITV